MGMLWKNMNFSSFCPSMQLRCNITQTSFRRKTVCGTPCKCITAWMWISESGIWMESIDLNLLDGVLCMEGFFF
jgi:hypothetical protein